MSLEAKIEELTAAVTALTSIISASGSGTVTKPAAAKAEDKKAEDKPARGRKPAAAKAPSTKELADVATKFLDEAEGNEDAYAARRGLINELREKYDLKKLSDAAEEDRQAIIDAIKEFGEANPADADDDAGI